MPFCRKCGRRLREYSKKCTECGTSTTAVIINVKKGSTNHLFRDPVAQAKPTKVPLPVDPITPKVISPKSPSVIKANPVCVLKPVVRVAPAVPVVPVVVYPPHEIIKSKLSVEKDIVANPKDYEKQVFEFDLRCPHGHLWPEGNALPVSKGVAFCPKCGTKLRKPKPKHHQRHYHSF
ncbi:hypothetical protein [Candidatus Bathycorpusculum sp.]|jgi:hypothetical protein|uniref:hypothetical protein n=1 Tax=Candidatus Bathycorpusculum sp. TaxID=2994959 RepID=UPI00281C49F7|nr:hypothetical protein [Candidatus Termitimicrobium sp.]MCL2686868.1 hypothetical protein [Candidatus Termitimicrobium sp.]